MVCDKKKHIHTRRNLLRSTYAGARPCIFYPNFILLKFGYCLDKVEKPTLSKFYPDFIDSLYPDIHIRFGN